MITLLLDTENIIDEKSSGERIEDGGTVNTVVLGQIQVILDTINNFGKSSKLLGTVHIS